MKITTKENEAGVGIGREEERTAHSVEVWLDHVSRFEAGPA